MASFALPLPATTVEPSGSTRTTSKPGAVTAGIRRSQHLRAGASCRTPARPPRDRVPVPLRWRLGTGLRGASREGRLVCRLFRWTTPEARACWASLHWGSPGAAPPSAERIRRRTGRDTSEGKSSDHSDRQDRPFPSDHRRHASFHDKVRFRHTYRGFCCALQAISRAIGTGWLRRCRMVNSARRTMTRPSWERR